MKFSIIKSDDIIAMKTLHIRDNRLSLKGKGLLSLLLVLEVGKDWDGTQEGLQKYFVDKETSVETGIEELKKNGYLKIVKKYPNETLTGRFEYEYLVYESPQINAEFIYSNEGITNEKVSEQGVGIQGVENHPLEYPLSDSPDIYEITNKTLLTEDNSFESSLISGDNSEAVKMEEPKKPKNIFSEEKKVNYNLTPKNSKLAYNISQKISKMGYPQNIKELLIKWTYVLYEKQKGLSETQLIIALEELNKISNSSNVEQIIKDTILGGYRSFSWASEKYTNHNSTFVHNNNAVTDFEELAKRNKKVEYSGLKEY